VRIDTWNPKERIARAIVVEAIEAIERGARIGPLARRFTVTPPVRNDTDVEASVITAVRPNQLFGSNQVLFIDKGEDAMKAEIFARGDAQHRSGGGCVAADGFEALALAAIVAERSAAVQAGGSIALRAASPADDEALWLTVRSMTVAQALPGFEL
jgi:hypothetical protein